MDRLAYDLRRQGIAGTRGPGAEISNQAISESLERHLGLGVALVAAAMLLLEITLTRLFSVLFLYHYSFFAISMVMSGLTLGGLQASRWNVSAMSGGEIRQRLAGLALFFSAWTFCTAICMALYRTKDMYSPPPTSAVLLISLIFIPGLTAAGAFLATAFAHREAWIGRLYACDLIAAALACLCAILLMRSIGGASLLLAPVLLSALAALVLARNSGRQQAGAGALVLVAVGGIAANHLTDGRVLGLKIAEEPVIERWNEHSRIIVLPQPNKAQHTILRLVIDRGAATKLYVTPPRAEGEPPPAASWWNDDIRYVGYRLGRPIDRVAIIGVGAGRDILAPIASGAKHVDGYELNGIILDLLKNVFVDFSDLAKWPEVSLVHSEARVGIKNSGKRYDVIQASMIDTWAATASGGFVLSENGVYTLEGWRTFFDALDDDGLLTMTRWFLPQEPAEAERLISLAVALLDKCGVKDPARHIILLGEREVSVAKPAKGVPPVWTTIVVSKSPIAPEEMQKILEIQKKGRWHVIAGPGIESYIPEVNALLDPARRNETIADSPYDISPPTDLRPYFFLQLRAFDIFRFWNMRIGAVTDITFNAVRVMMLICGVTLAITLVVALMAVFTLPSAAASREDRRVYRWMTPYFLGIGLGYMFVQLGLHQRLSIILGHPTTALSVVLFSMLLGTGVGSAASARLFAPGKFHRAWALMLAVLVAVFYCFPMLSAIESIGSGMGRAAVCAVVLMGTGFVLGFGFPLGVRLVAPTGEWAVQKMWATNGAASIAGSAAAAVIGVGAGSRGVLAAGLLAYALVFVCGVRAQKLVGGAAPKG